MYNRNLDDLIIEEPESEGSKLKNILTLLALVAIIIILGTILYRLVTGGSDIEPKKEPSSEKKEVIQKSEDTKVSEPKENKTASEEILPAELHPIIKDRYSEPQSMGFTSKEPKEDYTANSDSQNSDDAIAKEAKEVKQKRHERRDVKPKTASKVKHHTVKKQSPATLFRNVEHSKSISNKKRLYYVQVGSFKRQPAESFLNKLRDSGFHPVLVKSGSMIKVRVGPYPTRAKANEALKQVKTKLGISGFVLRKK